MGIEPILLAWHTSVLPLNYTRIMIFDCRFWIFDCVGVLDIAIKNHISKIPNSISQGGRS